MFDKLINSLQHASKHPFYEKKWGRELCAEVNNLAHKRFTDHEVSAFFKALPSLSREDIEHISPSFVQESPIISIRHTTGTTSKPLLRYRGTKEACSLARHEDYNNLKLALHVIQTYHGGQSLIGTDTIDFYCNVLDESSLRNADRLLRETFTVSGGCSIEIIYAPWLHFILLTSWLAKNDIDPSSYNVKKVILFGGHFSPFIERQLKDYWGDIIEPRYSLSEVAYASTLKKGAGYRMRSTKGCLVHLKSINGNNYNIGFTELYPIGYNQPIIKYYTDDIVRKEGGYFNVIGRKKHSLFTNGNVLIGSNQLRNIIDKASVPRLTPQYDFHGSLAKYAYPIYVNVTQPSSNSISIQFPKEISATDKQKMLIELEETFTSNGVFSKDSSIICNSSVNCFLPK